MKRYAVVLIGLALAGCSLQPSAAPATPAAAACRLPVLQGDPWTPGFVTVPGGAFTAATGESGTYYDRPYKQWVPWRPPWLSADGSRYIYVEGDRTQSWVQVVDVRSGTHHVVAVGGPWLVVGLSADAAFLMRVDYVDTAAYGTVPETSGLWKVALDAGTPVQVTGGQRSWVWVTPDGVFGDDSWTNDAGGPNDVVRLNAKTLQQQTWFSHNLNTRVIAVDANGAAFVLTRGDGYELWRVPKPGNELKIWSGPANGLHPEAPVAIEGAEVWFSSSSPAPPSAIYHYAPQTGMQVVATFNDRPVTVAGSCA